MKRLLISFGAGALLCGCGAMESAETGEGIAPPEEQVPLVRMECVNACVPGALDTTFGGDGTGIARLSIKPDDAGGFTALDLDLSGSGILAAGWGVGGLGGSTFKLSRLRPDGTPDPTFGSGKVVSTQWGASTANYAVARAVGIQHGGWIVAIGSFDDVKSQDIALARYDAEGALDTQRFAGGGKPIVDLGGAEIIRSGLVTPGDDILAVGSRDGQLLVARFTPDGRLDTGFGRGTGYFVADEGDASEAAAVTLDDAGDILVAGSTTVDQRTDVLVMRLTRDGSLDRTFGDGGAVVAGERDRDERAVAVAVTASGDVVVAGDTGGDDADFLVGRFLWDGTPDFTFGSGGVAEQPTTPGADTAEGMAVFPGGRVLVVGNSRREGGEGGPIVARYTGWGELDRAFGTGGIQAVNLGEYGVAHAVVLDTPCKALIGGGDEGATPGPGTYAVVARMCM